MSSMRATAASHLRRYFQTSKSSVVGGGATVEAGGREEVAVTQKRWAGKRVKVGGGLASSAEVQDA